MMPRLEKTYSSRARVGVMSRSEWPTTVQSRATYSSANATTAPTSIDGEQRAEPGVELRHRGQDHRQHVEDDDGDDQPDEARADRMRQMIVFEQFVEPVPQIRVADRASYPERSPRSLRRLRRRPSPFRSPTAPRPPWRHRGRRPAPCRAARRRPCRRALRRRPCAPDRPR